MKLNGKFIPLAILVILAVPVLSLLLGCGTESGAPATLTLYEKCENWANDTDIFQTAPANDTLSLAGTFLGGQFQYTLIYVLADQQGDPRNGVCVSFSTNGSFYLDEGRTMPITPSVSGVTNMVLRTDQFGTVYVYWATEDLPPAPGAGASDEKGQSWVTAVSGVLTRDFTVDWTVAAAPTP